MSRKHGRVHKYPCPYTLWSKNEINMKIRLKKKVNLEINVIIHFINDSFYSKTKGKTTRHCKNLLR